MWSGVRERTARRAQGGGCRSLIRPHLALSTLATRLWPLLTSHHTRRQPRSLHRRRVLESSTADIDPRRRMDPVSMAVLATERNRGVNVSTFVLRNRGPNRCRVLTAFASPYSGLAGTFYGSRTLTEVNAFEEALLRRCRFSKDVSDLRLCPRFLSKSRFIRRSTNLTHLRHCLA